MYAKKYLPIVLILIIIVLILGGNNAQAKLLDFSAASAVGDPLLGKDFVVSALDNTQLNPAVAYNWKHDEYLVVWQNNWGGNRDIYAQRITGKGELKSWFAVGSTAPMNPFTNDKAQPSVDYDPVNDRYLVAWAYDTNGDGSNWDIHGVFVNWDGPIPGLHEFVICNWGTQQWTPKVAYTRAEEEFMIVWWTDHPSVPDYISGRRMKAADGTMPTLGSDFTISHTTDLRVNPEIAYNLARNEYLVVYDDTQDIFGTRFTGKAQPLGGGEFGIAGWPGAETQPSVAACKDTNQYLVAWQNPQPDIYARFIKGDGTLDGGPLQLFYTSVREIYPEVACNSIGNQFLVVWQHQYSSLTGPYGVWGQFVNNDKTLGNAFWLAAPTAGVTAEFTRPVVAGGSPNYLAVWENDRPNTGFQDIHARLITKHAMYLPFSLKNHP